MQAATRVESIFAMRVTRCDDLAIPSPSDHLLLIDNGCDISIISKNSFLIQNYFSKYYNVDGVLPDMTTSSLQLVNDCFTCACLPNNKLVIFKLNQCLLDLSSKNKESLLQPHQARAFGVIVDDVATRHLGKDYKPGGQSLTIGNDTLPLHFDGWKCYFTIRKPSPEELRLLPVYELASPLAYKPQHNYTVRRLNSKHVDVGVEEWRKRLGFPTFETTKASLDVTTQMVPVLQAESR